MLPPRNSNGDAAEADQVSMSPGHQASSCGTCQGSHDGDSGEGDRRQPRSTQPPGPVPSLTHVTLTSPPTPRGPCSPIVPMGTWGTTAGRVPAQGHVGRREGELERGLGPGWSGDRPHVLTRCPDCPLRSRSPFCTEHLSPGSCVHRTHSPRLFWALPAASSGPSNPCGDLSWAVAPAPTFPPVWTTVASHRLACPRFPSFSSLFANTGSGKFAEDARPRGPPAQAAER